MRIILLIAALAVALPLHAKDRVRLRHYNPTGKLIYYTDCSLAMQAARFDMPAPGFVRSIAIMVGGPVGASATVHVYGGEGGMDAPAMGLDLAPSMMIRKTRAGIERIDIKFPHPVYVGSEQFFVALDDISPKLALLSDRRLKKPHCVGKSDAYYYQVLKRRDGSWYWGKYGFAIDVEVEYSSASSQQIFIDNSKDARLSDSVLNNNGIAWADIDDDRYLDLLAGGKLFRNSGSGEFADITESAGMYGRPKLQAFLDADNDARMDVLFIASDSADEANSTLFLNKGNGLFAAQPLGLEGITDPTCFGIADVDGDGYLDLYVGQGSGQAHNVFINNHRGSFARDTSVIQFPSQSGPVTAAEWADVNNDGYPDLFISAGDGSIAMVLRHRRDGGFAPAFPIGDTTSVAGSRGRIAGCSWADYDNDGDLDLLLPTTVDHRSTARERGDAILYANAGGPDHELVRANDDLGIRYVAERAGGCWGDVDNNGLLDAIMTTSCNCSYISLQAQTTPGTFEERTFEAGLRALAAGPDAVLADYDNDGDLDLSMMQGGRIRLYTNQSPASNNFIDVELDDPSGNRRGVGARVTAYSGAHRYTREVASGRAAGVQDPLRLHIGLGSDAVVDSVAVRWPGSSASEIFTNLEANRLHVLKSGRAASSVVAEGLTIQALPNPFNEKLRFTYTLPTRLHVRLEIYSATGQLTGILVDEEQAAGEHGVIWEAKGRDDERLSQGTYLYRLVTSGGEVDGKVLLQR
jgi:hypothetical protein